MEITKLFICTLCLWSLGTTIALAQSGDQILDGIGETGLIARYVFDGDAKDWSRNNLHGNMQGTNVAFTNDEKFGEVLSLEENGAFISLPGEAVTKEESLSITGWVYLRSAQQGQRLFDFGKDNTAHFFVAMMGTDEKGLQTEIRTESGKSYKTEAPALEADKWSHIAVVVNIPSKSLRTYINGKLVGETNNIELELEQVFNNISAEKNKLYIGKSLSSGAPSLNAKLHDFRIYRIPLNGKQAARIYYNALHDGETLVNQREEPDDNLPVFTDATPQLYNQFLVDVEDIEVTTTLGYLPRLPRFVKASYNDGITSHKTRVIWPAPKNNDQVLQTGQYTVIGQIPGSNLQTRAVVTVKDVKPEAAPDRVLEVFELQQVELRKDSHGEITKFMENRDKFISTLAKTNPDSFLYMFRNAFGQEQPEGAEPLGVWDSQETKLRGHATGHYLTAIAQAYASTGYNEELQEVFAQKMQYMVQTLYELSELSGKPKTSGGEFVANPTKVPYAAHKSSYDSDLSEAGIRTDYWNWGAGFISAYPPDQFIMLEKGATYGGQNTQIWAPYYTLHKILAGLLDVYEVSGNEKALEVALGMGNWVAVRMRELSTDTLISMWNSYIAGEFGGMNEVMARMYRLSGKESYLEVARLFDNIKMFYGDAQHTHGLAMNVDTFRGLHANQHIPQIVGALEMYRDTKEAKYYHISDNFWFKTTKDYMYSIGGVAGARNPANAECFPAQPATLYEHGFSSGGQNETCATYNMLKLTKNLFLFDPKATYMDYYERGLYNHILASVAEDSPANTYHVPLRPGSVKHFGNPDMKGFTCCNGTAIESSTKLQNSIYFKSQDNKTLYVNLFIPSALNWSERNIRIDQITAFPKEDRSVLKVQGKGKFDLRLRIPGWATNGFIVKINGKIQKTDSTPGTYISINRNWKNGDTVELQMPFDFRLEPVMDQQNIASLFYGPVLLAAQEEQPRIQWHKIDLNAKNIGKNIEGDPKELEFSIDGIHFKPFYQTYGRHSVYLDVNLQ